MNKFDLQNLPSKFVRLITESHGAKGSEWLAELPKIVGDLEREMSLKVGKPFENLSYHFVAPCVSPQGEAVLKIGFPEEDSPVFNEAEMLKLYGGKGAVKFLAADTNRFVLLLEKLDPGEHLKKTFPDNPEKACEIAANVLRKIKREIPEKHNFIHLEKWFAGFEKAGKTKFPAEQIKKAKDFYTELATAENFLIHGDFHHENILSAEREPFLAIDPKGVIGQIGYEIGVFLNNHLWWLERDTDLQNRLDFAVEKFSETFEIMPQDLRKWAYAQAVLSAWWTFEENGANWQTDLASAEIWKV